METNDLQTAVSLAQAKYGPEWPLMGQKAQADAIYRELRELDHRAITQAATHQHVAVRLRSKLQGV